MENRFNADLFQKRQNLQLKILGLNFEKKRLKESDELCKIDLEISKAQDKLNELYR